MPIFCPWMAKIVTTPFLPFFDFLKKTYAARFAIYPRFFSPANNWFEELADYSAFKNVVGLSSGDLRIRYDMELVLRFMAFLSDSDYESKLKNFNSVDVFLTHVLRGFIKEEKFDYEGKEALFKRTFDAIYAAYGKDALKYKNAPATGKFSISFFEAVAFGIAQNLNELPDNEDLKSKIVSIAKDSRYSKVSGSGKNIKSRTPALLALGKEYFKKSQ